LVRHCARGRRLEIAGFEKNGGGGEIGGLGHWRSRRRAGKKKILSRSQPPGAG